MADEVTGKLARKVQERERERESEALIERPTDPLAEAQRKEDEREGWMRFPVALIWAVAIAVGLATGSAPRGLATFVALYLVFGVLVLVRRAVP